MHAAQPHRDQRTEMDLRKDQPRFPTPGNLGQDLCLPIQADLSAMLDGELDPAGVRRVTMHSDACHSCRSFFDGIREQVGLHRRFAAVLPTGELPAASSQRRDEGGDGQLSGSKSLGRVGDENAALRRQLTGNQRKLSRILYELGRNLALMGLSPEFSREVAKEPMPVPDMSMRGRSLLD